MRDGPHVTLGHTSMYFYLEGLPRSSGLSSLLPGALLSPRAPLPFEPHPACLPTSAPWDAAFPGQPSWLLSYPLRLSLKHLGVASQAAGP